jgi:hypothetical protein
VIGAQQSTASRSRRFEQLPRNISRASSGALRRSGEWRKPTVSTTSSAGENIGRQSAAFAKPSKRKPDNPEHRAQVALVQWANLTRVPGHRGEPAKDVVPGSKVGDYLFAIPNGLRVRPAQAGKAKAEGLKAGVWDLFLPLSRLGYLGLFVESKSAEGYLSPDQRDFRERADLAGYATVVYYGDFERAADCLKAYLEGNEPNFNLARERAACRPSSRKSPT